MLANGLPEASRMEQGSTPVGSDVTRVGLTVLALMAVWSLVIAVSLLSWNGQAEREAITLARNEAIANFNKDQAFRVWGTDYGGVYVPVSEETPPNPCLDHVEDRDVLTQSGRKLTLMNPAYMVRQMMDRYSDNYGIRGRITSLKPLNPDNAPDAWEQSALWAFENGVEEVFELSDEADGHYLRLMRPMVTLEGCLKCHAEQGYKVVTSAEVWGYRFRCEPTTPSPKPTTVGTGSLTV
ncbi:MAG: DUF3365 domain-containing protein [Halieaceae bacterium]|jgi:hypothetical protein|nr:DUF3365 domain-containing protein [Halieaceae bacterium]